jgi:hypothetical protein
MNQASTSALTSLDIEKTMQSLRNVCEEDLCLDGLPGAGKEPAEGSEPSQGQGGFRVLLSVLELVVGLLLFAGTIFYLIQAYDLPKPFNPIDIGAGGFPTLLAVITLAFLGLMIALAVYHLLLGGKAFGTVTVHRPLSVVSAAVLLVGQALFFEKAGVYACVGLFSLLIMFVCGERRFAHLLGVPVALISFIYFVFSFTLKVNLP